MFGWDPMKPDADRLSPLFRQYRESCPEVEPGPEFMPRMWERIDARRSLGWKLRIYTRGIATAALTVCLALAAMLYIPTYYRGGVYDRTYLEALEDDQAPEALAYSDVLHIENHAGAPGGAALAQ